MGTTGCLSPEGAPGSGDQMMHIPATKVHSVLALYVECKAVLVGLATTPGLFLLVSWCWELL